MEPATRSSPFIDAAQAVTAMPAAHDDRPRVGQAKQALEDPRQLVPEQ